LDKFNSKHIIFLILGTGIVSLKTYPAVFMRPGGRDSWIAIIITSILISAYFIYIVSVCRKTNTYSFYKIFCGAFGNILGTVLLLVYLSALFITLVESSSAEANSMHTNMLLNTPQWFFLIFFIFPALYTIKKGKVAVISVTCIGIVLIIIAGINLAMLTAKYKNYRYLFPVFKNGITTGFLLSIVKSLGLYSSIAIVFPYLSEIQENKKLIRHSLLGLIFLIQMQIISVTGIIMTFGINRGNLISYPKLIQTQRVSLFDFLDAGELFVMLQIVGGWFIKYILTFFAAAKLLKDMNFGNKYLHYIISFSVYAASFYISENLFRLFKFFDFYSYISILGFIIVPLAAFVTFHMKNYTKKV
jgi:spore germination protein (amino acid permease)